ncbi:MAG: tRNA (N6-isopentenyl adenosine(37)-C2)-methylthiotransferase MiaB [Myxococcales bacterium]
MPTVPVKKRFYIHTFGCQMNEHDSARMGESLARAGWIRTGEPDAADLVLLNTCAIREKAEDKLYSALGRYRLLKSSRGARIGVAGCVAQQEKEALLARAPYVDFVLGPDQLARVSDLAEQGGIETGWMPSEEYVFPRADPETSRGSATAFVLAMKGCDNVCSFCVVPHTRGREVSRPYSEIVREVQTLVEVSVREVTLIGQNVNSYAGGCSFAELIRRVAAVPGLRRIRFTTSHPMDLSPELTACFRDVPQLMPHFHLPVQHGSDAVLARMRRRYTIAQYEERVASLVEACPTVALTTDIICGFPGESEAEHAQTLLLLERVQYDNLFSFVYSERPHTAASLRLEKERAAAVKDPAWAEVPREIAVRRLEEVQAIQFARTVRRHRDAVGREVEVLVESARTEPGVTGERFGRSRENWTVHFQGDCATADIVRVRVTRASLVALSGVQESVSDPAPFAPAKVPRTRLAVLSG